MKKLDIKKVIFSLSAIVLTVVGIVFFMQSGMATNPVVEENIGLSIDKLDKDTLKIALSNVSDVPRALQFSIKIDGNVYFNEDSLKWLVDNKSNSTIQKNVKLSDDKKTLEFFIVSNEALTKSSGTIEIGEIDVISPNNKAVKYKITSDLKADGTGYKYVINSTNKQVTGPAMNLVDEGVVTYNTAPTLSLAQSSQVVEGKLILTEGDSLTEEQKKSFVVANDDEDGELTEIKVSGNVDTSIVGSYLLTYEVSDSLDEKATLELPVIVENKPTETIKNPTIEGVKDEVQLVVGDSFDPLEGVKATDYAGRNLEIKLSGDYTDTLVDGVVTKEGIYTIYYDTEDRYGNVSPQHVTTLIVSKKTEENPSEPEIPEKPEYEIPESIKDLIDETILKPVSGNGSELEPLVFDILETASAVNLQSMMERFLGYQVEVKLLETRHTLTYSITLISEADTQYLLFNVQSSQSDVVSYLNNLINNSEKPGTGDNGSTEETEKPGTGDNGSTEETEKPGTGDNGSTGETEKPGTGDNGSTGETEKPGTGDNGSTEGTTKPGTGNNGSTGETTKPGTGNNGSTGETTKPGTSDNGSTESEKAESDNDFLIEDTEKSDDDSTESNTSDNPNKEESLSKGEENKAVEKSSSIKTIAIVITATVATVGIGGAGISFFRRGIFKK